LEARRELRRKPKRADERRTKLRGSFERQLWTSAAAALPAAASERAGDLGDKGGKNVYILSNFKILQELNLPFLAKNKKYLLKHFLLPF